MTMAATAPKSRLAIETVALEAPLPGAPVEDEAAATAVPVADEPATISAEPVKT